MKPSLLSLAIATSALSPAISVAEDFTDLFTKGKVGVDSATATNTSTRTTPWPTPTPRRCARG